MDWHCLCLGHTKLRQSHTPSKEELLSENLKLELTQERPEFDCVTEVLHLRHNLIKLMYIAHSVTRYISKLL